MRTIKQLPIRWKILIASIIVGIPLLVAAQQSIMLGVDGNGVVRPIQVDGTGNQVITSTAASGAKITIPVTATKTATTTTIDIALPSGSQQNVPANSTPCTVPGGASCTLLYGAPIPGFSGHGTDWSAWPNLTITVTNEGGANPLTDCIVAWSPAATADGDAHQEAWDKTTFAGLALSTAKSLAITGNSRKYLTVWGRSALGTSVDVYITASQN